MKTFFEDEFINKKIFSRLIKEVKKEQLNKTLEEIDYLNELQEHLLSTTCQRVQINAKPKSLQA